MIKINKEIKQELNHIKVKLMSVQNRIIHSLLSSKARKNGKTFRLNFLEEIEDLIKILDSIESELIFEGSIKSSSFILLVSLKNLDYTKEDNLYFKLLSIKKAVNYRNDIKKINVN